MVHVFIVGSKGIPARYGGFETFVEKLTEGKRSAEIRYHVSCMNNDEKHFEYNGADCFNVALPLPGAPGRIFHVSRALSQVERWRRENPDCPAIVYILGCRIGPMLYLHTGKLRKLGVKICCNPDGLEWKRGKWNWLAKRFLKLCERCLVRGSDLVICDSVAIEAYIRSAYGNHGINTTYIAYGADPRPSTCEEDVFLDWCGKNGIIPGDYYLSIGRFVPENNIETVIREFMTSHTQRNLVIITNIEQNRFYRELLERTGFQSDQRIKFVGTVYNGELVKKIRENALAYIHGHEVGGTNPSLLEALASTRVNLLLDVAFNREVADNAALYWTKTPGSLVRMIDQTDGMRHEEMNALGRSGKERIRNTYRWDDICDQYERLWLKECVPQ